MARKPFTELVEKMSPASRARMDRRARTLSELIAELPAAEREAIERRADELRQLALARRIAGKRRGVLRKLAK